MKKKSDLSNYRLFLWLHINIEALLYLSIIVGIIIINPTTMMNSSLNKKFFFLAALIGVLVQLRVLDMILFKKAIEFNVKIVDIIIIISILYIILNRVFVAKMLFSTQYFLEFIIIVTLFYLLRSSPTAGSMFYLYFLISFLLYIIYGSLQSYRILDSFHPVFNITGNFYNPNIYMEYLASIFPLALAFFISKDIRFEVYNTILQNTNNYKVSRIAGFSILSNINRHKFDIVIRVIILVMIILMLRLNIKTFSRGALISIILSTIYLLSFNNWVKLNLMNIRNSWVKRIGLFFISATLFTVIISGLYYSKKDSADGRLFIWKNTLNMINDKPIFGHGIESFESLYMEYQADYFYNNKGSAEEKIASDNYYAFNEILKVWSEIGIIGVLFQIILILIILDPFHKGKKWGDVPFILIAYKAGIISMIIISLFSYPSNILQLKCNFIIYSSIIINNLKTIKHFKLDLRNQIIRRAIKPLLFFLLTSINCYYCLHISNYYIAYKNSRRAYEYYESGSVMNATLLYEMAYRYMKSNGYFLIKYAEALIHSSNYIYANMLLNEAKTYVTNSQLYNNLGRIYEFYGNTANAESSYIHSMIMVPKKLYSKYLLSNLYFSIGKDDQAKKLALEIINDDNNKSTTLIDIKKELKIKVSNP